MGNTNLHEARRAERDEFYTQIGDVEKEVAFYRPHFAGKSVFLNADDPRESAFFEYFALNFHTLGLRKLVAIGYEGSPIVGEQLPLFDMAGMKHRARGMSGKQAHVVEITHVPDYAGKGATDLTDIDELLRSDYATVTALQGDGDFRSPESVRYLEEADVVVTNPPFSLFREYMAQLVDYGKDFLVLGNMNAVTYKEIFPLIKDGKVWYGPSISSGDREFRVPDHYPLQAAGWRVDEDGNKYIRVKGVRWFTNLEHAGRKATIPLFRRYADDPAAYPTYDNYDAIEVGRVKDIPVDYDGIMGVPITFLDKHNPNQFQIVGSRRWAKTPELLAVYTGTAIPPESDKKTLINGRETYDRIFIRRVPGV